MFSFLSFHCVFQINHGCLRGSQSLVVAQHNFSKPTTTITTTPQDFLSLRPQWMIEKDGYIFVYSMNSRHSLDELQHFYELHQQINEHRDVPIVLVANKKDLCGDGRGQVTSEEGMEQAKQWNATYIETSAFTGENVEASFKTFIREVRKLRAPKAPPPTGFCTLL
jgi:GTPase SAR1 family protein